MKKYHIKAFTLIEVVIVATIFFTLVVVITSLFIDMIKIKGGLDARQHLIKESYHMIEKVQTLSKNYTLDYEEYRNRKKVGCNTLGDEEWADGCSMMTYYGNRNTIGSVINPLHSILYYCSSVSGVRSYAIPVVEENVSIFPCLPPAFVSNSNGFHQGYGQYTSLFTDVLGDVDNVPGAVFDDDDDDLGVGPEAIFQSTGVQELYLISHDKSSRVFIRRNLLEEGDWNDDGVSGNNDNEKLYALQILKLKGLDAGSSHDFSADDAYDGVVDTRVCDTGLGFVCGGVEVGGAYVGYYLPQNSDDGWVNLSSSDITVSDRNIVVYPYVDPISSWNSSQNQISPHIYIVMNTKLYGKNRSSKLTWDQIDLYSLRLQTMLSLPFL